MVIIWILFLFSVLFLFKEPIIHVKRENIDTEDKNKRMHFGVYLVIWVLFFPKFLQETFLICAPIIIEE